MTVVPEIGKLYLLKTWKEMVAEGLWVDDVLNEEDYGIIVQCKRFWDDSINGEDTFIANNQYCYTYETIKREMTTYIEIEEDN